VCIRRNTPYRRTLSATRYFSINIPLSLYILDCLFIFIYISGNFAFLSERIDEKETNCEYNNVIIIRAYVWAGAYCVRTFCAAGKLRPRNMIHFVTIVIYTPYFPIHLSTDGRTPEKDLFGFVLLSQYIPGVRRRRRTHVAICPQPVCTLGYARKRVSLKSLRKRDVYIYIYIYILSVHTYYEPTTRYYFSSFATNKRATSPAF